MANTRIYLLLEENTILIGATNVLTFSTTGKSVGLSLTVNECINRSGLVSFAMQKTLTAKLV